MTIVKRTAAAAAGGAGTPAPAAAPGPAENVAAQPEKGGKRQRKPEAAWVVALRDYHGHFCYAVVVLTLLVHSLGVKDMSDTVWLSHYVPGIDSFRPGPDDVYFVAFWVLALSALRLAMQGAIFTPIAYFMGCPTAERTKFLDMAWQGFYYTSAWSAGVYLAFLGPDAYVKFDGFWEETVEVWRGYPHRMHAPMKAYYLMQASFWLHMIVVTAIEERRKDFVPMMAHHVVTSILIFSSYICGFVRVGTLVLVNQDTADILLPVAKMLKYCKFETLSTVVFALFSLVWIPTRHWLYFCPLYSLYVYAPQEVTLPFDPSQGQWYHPLYTPVYFSIFMGLLQMLLLYWLYLLLQAVYRAVTSSSTIEDQRSDDEGDDQPTSHAHAE